MSAVRPQSLTRPLKSDVLPPIPVTKNAEIIKNDFEIRDYKQIIDKSGVERELLLLNYAPLSKIIVNDPKKKLKYIKAKNCNGQNVYIQIDIDTLTPLKQTDVALIETNSGLSIPYSIKTAAMTCAQNDVCGVAFECDDNGICMLVKNHSSNSMEPVETNYVHVETKNVALIGVEKNDNITMLPVIKLSEIKANPDGILANTDAVLKRLRNTTYASLIQDIAASQQNIIALNESLIKFNNFRELIVNKLSTKLAEYKKLKSDIEHEPESEDQKQNLRNIRNHLGKCNDDIDLILNCMRKVSEQNDLIIEALENINMITSYCSSELP